MKTENPDQEPRKKVWLRYVAIGALATVILVCVKLFVEHTEVGKEYELWAFGQLQGMLAPIDLDNPVVVLDISAVPGGRVDQPTPREQLKEIIQALATLQPPPRAIAVDVNFSPRETKPSAEDDEEFFDFCLSVTKARKVPIFLAVAETKSAPPEAWLGSELYKDLAVAVAADPTDTRHIPLWVKSSESPEKLKMMNYALAREYRKHLPGAHPWIAWAVESHGEEGHEPDHHEKPIDGETTVTYENSLVNYSKLDQIKLAASADTNKDAIKRAAAKYSNKLVILGDLVSPDKVPVPGRVINEAGSLVLASATYTLIKEPLYEFKWWVRLGLDFTIAGLIVVAVALIRRRSRDDSWIGKQALFVYVAVAVVWFAGWRLVSWAGVLWLDFLLVALALLLHPKTEHLIDKLLEKLRKRSKPAVKTASVALLFLLAMSTGSSAQQATMQNRCEKLVAAVGVKLDTGKRSKKKKAGTCYFRENRTAAWQPLTDSNVTRQYRSREHVYCDPDCSVTIYFCGTQTQEVINTREPDWFPIIHAYRPAPLRDPNPYNMVRVAQAFSPRDPRLGDERRLMFGGRTSNLLYGKNDAENAKRSAGESTTASRSGSESKETKEKKVKAALPPSSAGGAVASTASSAPSGAAASTAVVDDERLFTELLDEGQKARQMRAYALAQDTYLKAQQARPDDYRGFQGLGNIFADQKNWVAAEDAYRKALALRPYFSAELNMSLAHVMLQEMVASGDYRRASEVEEHLRIASLSSSPADERVYDLFAQLFELTNTDLALAEYLFGRAVRYAPRSSKANLRLARVLYRLDRSEEALRYVKRADKHANGEQLMDVARMYEVLGRYKDAERVLQTALKQTPNNPAVVYNLGSVMLQRKHYGSALRILKRAVQLEPDAFAPALAYGIARFRTNDFTGAENTLDDASRKVADNADGLQRLAYWFSALGDAYFAKRKIADAIRVYEKSIIHAENPDVRDRLLQMKQERDAKTP